MMTLLDDDELLSGGEDATSPLDGAFVNIGRGADDVRLPPLVAITVADEAVAVVDVVDVDVGIVRDTLLLLLLLLLLFAIALPLLLVVLFELDSVSLSSSVS